MAQYEQQMYKCIHDAVKRTINDEEMEEFIGVAHMGLCKAARNFKPNKKMTFESFAYLNISSAVKSSITSSNRLVRVINKIAKSLDEPVDDTDKLFLKDALISCKDIEVYETSLRIVQYLHTLPYKAKKILKLRLYNGWEYIKIRDELGLSSNEMRELLLKIQDHDRVKILKRSERNG